MKSFGNKLSHHDNMIVGTGLSTLKTDDMGWHDRDLYVCVYKGTHINDF